MFTTFVLNAEGQVIYTCENSENLEAAIRVGKATLHESKEAKYAFVIESLVTRNKQKFAFGVQFKWLKSKKK